MHLKYLDFILHGNVAVKILAGLILFFLIMSFILFKRLRFSWRDLWKDRKKVAMYQQHINQIDNLLARAQALAKMKKRGDSDWLEKKAEIEAEIEKLLKQSPLNNLPQEQGNLSKLDIRAKLSESKLSGKFRSQK